MFSTQNMEQCCCINLKHCNIDMGLCQHDTWSSLEKLAISLWLAHFDHTKIPFCCSQGLELELFTPETESTKLEKGKPATSQDISTVILAWASPWIVVASSIWSLLYLIQRCFKLRFSCPWTVTFWWSFSLQRSEKTYHCDKDLSKHSSPIYSSQPWMNFMATGGWSISDFLKLFNSMSMFSRAAMI